MAEGIVNFESESINPELYANSHKVVVSKLIYDEWTIRSKWTLFKQVDEWWLPCRKDDPEDANVFDLAAQIHWLEFPIGEYDLSGAKLEAA